MSAQQNISCLYRSDHHRTFFLPRCNEPCSYGPFGESSPPFAGVRYNGIVVEDASGSYLLGNGHRAYNPMLRRFHSPDFVSPFGEGGINCYAYCAGDPINYIDPTARAGWLLSVGLMMWRTTKKMPAQISKPRANGLSTGQLQFSSLRNGRTFDTAQRHALGDFRRITNSLAEPRIWSDLRDQLRDHALLWRGRQAGLYFRNLSFADHNKALAQGQFNRMFPGYQYIDGRRVGEPVGRFVSDEQFHRTVLLDAARRVRQQGIAISILH